MPKFHTVFFTVFQTCKCLAFENKYKFIYDLWMVCTTQMRSDSVAHSKQQQQSLCCFEMRVEKKNQPTTTTATHNQIYRMRKRQHILIKQFYRTLKVFKLLSVWFAVQMSRIWVFAISFPPLVLVMVLLMRWPPFFWAKWNFERNPVINISEWFIRSIFIQCSSRDSFHRQTKWISRYRPFDVARISTEFWPNRERERENQRRKS